MLYPADLQARAFKLRVSRRVILRVTLNLRESSRSDRTKGTGYHGESLVQAGGHLNSVKRRSLQPLLVHGLCRGILRPAVGQSTGETLYKRR